MTGPYYPDATLPVETLDPGKVSRKIRARGGALMMVEVDFAAGGAGAVHDHPHEQVTYCLRGEFDFGIGKETFRLRPGDSVYIPGGAAHGVLCLAAGALLDVFTPQREDFLAK